MKKSAAIIFALAMLTGGALYAKPGHGPEQMGKPGLHKMGGSQMQKNRSMLVRLAGLESIVEKYKIKIQRVMLDSKEANLEYEAKKRQLHTEIGVATAKYEQDPGQFGKVIAQQLKQMYQLELKIVENREKAMEQIRKIHLQERKEISKGIENWIGTLATNPSEMKKFVNHINKIHAQQKGKGPK